MTKDEALKLALEALQSKHIVNCGAWRVQQDQAITKIKEALAQLEQEPDDLTIAYMTGFHDGKKKREWVGLTDEEVMEIAFNFDVPSLVVRTAEAKLKEKNS